MKEITRHRRASLLTKALGLAALTLMTATSAVSQDWKMLFGLRGDWKFELGDDIRWAEKNFNDSKWETIFAPAHWEDEGFPGYDGYAWYRKHFHASDDWRDKALYVRLGRIDDVDEVYVNGKLVGATGTFPPEYHTAYNQSRDYPLPISYLNIPGDNVIAVRVYDDQIEGGMVEGRLGVYEDRNALLPDIPLAGEWRFRTGDDPSWKEREVVGDESGGTREASMRGKKGGSNTWVPIHVPGNWERQGFGIAGSSDFEGYDGYAWYRLLFYVPKEFADKRMVLLLGMIDDFDETYLNGKLVGKTGRMGTDVRNTDDWQKLRAYTLLPGQLLAGEQNVIAVRVFDGWRGGGIYSGPIGIVTRDKFLKWERKKDDDWNFLERIFEKLR